MTRVGYHGSHEQHRPSALLEHVCAAERAGFAAAMCSDHFMPWSATAGQGQSGYTWSWLGAALQATQLSFGTVTAPGQRYHPAITAQAIATLSEMYPGRLWVALGTGEALNEHITGDAWPAKEQRRARLRECVDIIRALLAGETVTHRGLVRVRDATLFTRPATPPALLGAALTVETARWAGEWADGLITVSAEPSKLRPIIDAFREVAGARKPVYAQAAIAYARDEREAEHEAQAWRTAGIPDTELKGDLELPEQFDARSAAVTLDQLRAAVRISASAQRHVEWVAGDLEMGADRVYVHEVGPTQAAQQRFLTDVAAQLLRL